VHPSLVGVRAGCRDRLWQWQGRSNMERLEELVATAPKKLAQMVLDEHPGA
jgi:hypothetical protein